MYPIIRLFKERVKFRNAPPMGLFDTHVSHHICWPWDIDPWMELNNGRTLTLFDLGRMPFSARTGMFRAMRANGWGMAVAGNSTRYRRRIRMFHRFSTETRLLGWDRRFLYVEQSMWRHGEALNHILIRLAATDANGILPPEKLISAMGYPGRECPEMPRWVTDWIAADSHRLWPPAHHG